MMLENPCDMMVKRAGMIRSEFAEKYGFGKNLLLRLSQGRLQSVTPRIEAALWAMWQEKGISQDEFDAEYSTLSVDLAYQRWVTNRRLANRTKIPSGLIGGRQGVSPFARLVGTIGSVSKTAKTLAVPDVTVQRYADGRQREMPLPIKTALAEMRYPHLGSLEAAMERWHQGRS